MRLRRVYSEEPLAGRGQASLRGAAARHVIKVLRLRPGDELIVFDGQGGEYAARLAGNHGDHIELTLGEHSQHEVESALHLSLVLGISRGDRMDLVVQKATELGVQRIVPVLSERSVVRLDEERAARRLAHWRAIAASACEQCGRNRLPEIQVPMPLTTWLESCQDTGARLVLHHEGATRLAQAAPDGGGVALLVGPEGGLTQAELEAAAAAAFARVQLGPRVLRTETAAIAALSIVQALWGDG